VQRKGREELQEEGTDGLIYNLERWDPLEVLYNRQMCMASNYNGLEPMGSF
jgi:hypothetical protein